MAARKTGGPTRAAHPPEGRPLARLAALLVALCLAPDLRGDFAYRKTIAIDADRVAGGEDLADFPVLISIASDDELRSSENGGHVESPEGYDIIFRAADERTTLDHEIERYDASTGGLLAWVRVPTLHCDEDTVLYIYYGNPEIDAPTENPTGVWDSDFELVLHMDDATASTVEDSTSSGITGTKGSSGNPDEADGKIGPAQDFDAAAERIALEDAAAFTWTPVDEDRTLSLWLRVTALPEADGDPFQFLVTSGAPGNRYQWILVGRGGDRGLACVVCDSGWNVLGYFGCDWTPALDTWYHIAMVASSAGNNRIYIDGQSQTLTESSWDDAQSIDPTVTSVKDAYGNSTGTGSIDELRLSHAARSAGWIQTEYNNQSAPASFYAIGEEESVGVTEARLSSLTARWEGDAVVVRWRTASELGTLEFRIRRRRGRSGPFFPLSHDPIPSLGFSATGKEYAFRDTDVVPGEATFYLLEERDIWGGRSFHGPVEVEREADGMRNDGEREIFIRGDGNGDGRLDIADVIANLSYRMAPEAGVRCPRSFDLDDDGLIDLADGLFGLRFLFEGGPPPPAPFPACGRDLTPDSLPCELDRACPSGR